MSGFESAPPTELAVLTPSDGVPTGAAAGAAAAAKKPFSLFGEDGFSFADLIDIINPLQHIPLVSTLYRHLTGDVIDAAPRVLGGTLFGGPIGAIVSLINVFVEESTGKDMGEHAVALFTDEAPPEVVAVARNTVPEARFEEARFETAVGATRRAAAGEPLASDTDAIVATVRANRFAVASVAPMATMVRSEPLAPPLALVPPPLSARPRANSPPPPARSRRPPPRCAKASARPTPSRCCATGRRCATPTRTKTARPSPRWPGPPLPRAVGSPTPCCRGWASTMRPSNRPSRRRGPPSILVTNTNGINYRPVWAQSLNPMDMIVSG